MSFLESFQQWLEEELGGSNYEIEMESSLDDFDLDALAMLSLEERFEVKASPHMTLRQLAGALVGKNAIPASASLNKPRVGALITPEKVLSPPEPPLKAHGIVHDEDGLKFYFQYPDDALAEVNYRINGGVVDMVRTFVPEQWRGKMPFMSEDLPLAAYRWAKQKNLKIRQSCWYLRDLFGPQHSSEFGSLYVT